MGTIHHHHGNLILPHIEMDGSELPEAPNFDKLLGLKITPKFEWKSDIEAIGVPAGKMVGSLSRSRKFLTPSAILYLYKSQIRPTMEYCLLIWAGSPNNVLLVL